MFDLATPARLANDDAGTGCTQQRCVQSDFYRRLHLGRLKFTQPKLMAPHYRMKRRKFIANRVVVPRSKYGSRWAMENGVSSDYVSRSDATAIILKMRFKIPTAPLTR